MDKPLSPIENKNVNSYFDSTTMIGIGVAIGSALTTLAIVGAIYAELNGALVSGFFSAIYQHATLAFSNLYTLAMAHPMITLGIAVTVVALAAMGIAYGIYTRNLEEKLTELDQFKRNLDIIRSQTGNELTIQNADSVLAQAQSKVEQIQRQKEVVAEKNTAYGEAAKNYPKTWEDEKEKDWGTRKMACEDAGRIYREENAKLEKLELELSTLLKTVTFPQKK